MAFQPGANLYGIGIGSRPETVEVPHIDVRAPSSTDILYPIGKRWIYVNNGTYDLVGLTSSNGVTSATWSQLASSGGSVSTLTGDTGTATPTSGNIQIAGTANQITTTATGSAVTASLPAAITAPGSLATTTTLTAGTGLTVTSGGETITAGDLTLTAGSVIINGAGRQLRVHGGAATDFIGTATLASGTTGAIANTNITATDRIFIQRIAANASTTLGELSYTISAGASFTITSLILGTPASTQTADVSSVTYLIVRQV